MAKAKLTGTALPICLYWDEEEIREEALIELQTKYPTAGIKKGDN